MKGANMFYEFTITLENQMTDETMKFNKSIPYGVHYLDAWKQVSQIAFEALDALEVPDKHYWYIKSIEHRI